MLRQSSVDLALPVALTTLKDTINHHGAPNMPVKPEVFMKCSGVECIADINKQFEYEDNHPHGKGDSPLVSCGQTNGHNELQYIYNTKLKGFVDDPNSPVTEKKAYEALCLTCHELDSPRSRNKFYERLQQKLGVKFPD